MPPAAPSTAAASRSAEGRMPESVAVQVHRWRGAATVFLLIATSCTQLPTTGSVVLPPIPSGVARLWFYRDYEPHETLARPYVRLNDQVFGISEPGGASTATCRRPTIRSRSTAPA